MAQHCLPPRMYTAWSRSQNNHMALAGGPRLPPWGILPAVPSRPGCFWSEILLQGQSPVVRSLQFSFFLMLTWIRGGKSSGQEPKASAGLAKQLWCPSSTWPKFIWTPLWDFLLSPSLSPCLARWNQGPFHPSWWYTRLFAMSQDDTGSLTIAQRFW